MLFTMRLSWAEFSCTFWWTETVHTMMMVLCSSKWPLQRGRISRSFRLSPFDQHFGRQFRKPLSQHGCCIDKSNEWAVFFLKPTPHRLLISAPKPTYRKLPKWGTRSLVTFKISRLRLGRSASKTFQLVKCCGFSALCLIKQAEMSRQ